MRKSYGGELCTIRYTGPIPVWNEPAYGVEWDNPARGKHSGSFDGHQYFECRVAGAGSFLKSSKPSDPPTTFAQALKAKYAEKYHFDEVQVSKSKHIESVGMDKYFERHRNLDALATVSLENSLISSWGAAPALSNLRELDLSFNLFEDLAWLKCLEPLGLTRLNLRGNRFSHTETAASLHTVTELNLGSTLLTQDQLATALRAFPKLQRLGLAQNAYTEYPPIAIEWVDLAYNQLESVPAEGKALVLSNNKVLHLEKPIRFEYLNLCDQSTPTHLSLREIDNLFVQELWLSEANYARATIIGRLGSVTKLNGTTVTPEERRESELYLISQLEKKLVPPLPPLRDRQLRARYGPPRTFAPESIAARLVQVEVAGELYQIVGHAPVRRLKNLIAQRIGERQINMSLSCDGRLVDDDEVVRNFDRLDLKIDKNTLERILGTPAPVDNRIPTQPHAETVVPA